MSIKKECDKCHSFKRLINAVMRGHVDYDENGKVARIINYKTPMEIRDDIQKRK